MTVTVSGSGVILLRGVCPAEDAETLALQLSDEPGASVDWSACELAHTAVIQVLMAVRPKMVGVPPNAFLRDHIAEALSQPGPDA